MTITINGAPVAIEPEGSGSLGELLSRADELLDRAGSVIVSLSIDGEEVDAEGYARCAEREAASVGRVDIRAENAAAIKVRALETLLELLAIAKSSAEVPEEEAGAADWAGVRKGAADLSDAFAGLFAADELSFARLFYEVLERAGDEPDRASRIEISAQVDRLASVFEERLAELRSPAAEMRKTAALFDERSADLSDIPVLMQTGKEERAMKTVLFFVEIFNKVIRIIPELRRSGVDTDSIGVGGAPMPEFYGSFNGVLRQLTEAFEHKDAVLIGDLAEYEILPRMKSFFAAMREALPES
jgi:hypothetical protein